MSSATSIRDLHQFSGHPGEFWPAFLGFCCARSGARRAFLLERRDANWKIRLHWSSASHSAPEEPNLSFLSRVAEDALTRGPVTVPLAEGGMVYAFRPVEAEPAAVRVVLLLDEAADPTRSNDVLGRLELLADGPEVYRRQRDAFACETRLAEFAGLLDLLLLLNAETHFLSAAMVLVNETATRAGCTRVSLGWLDGEGYVRVRAISQMERFEEKMDLTVALQTAMEECSDQQEEILVPPPAKEESVSRSHAEYARHAGLRGVLSLPLRLDGRVVGVFTCEREETLFSTEDVRGLRLLCDQVARRLGDLQRQDRGLRARLGDALREKASGLFGVEHTLVKLAGATFFLLLLGAAVIHVPYRVEAPFILRSEDVRQVSVPFEGYIEDVHVRIGAEVEEGALLLTLDARELRLEESAAVANQVRYLREAEKARASGSLVDMKIAQAQADQAQARLDLIRHRLALAELRSPITGTLVEGDLEELRGAPVGRGDILFKIARHEALFAEIKVAERDIHELTVGQGGSLAFVSRPQMKFPVRIERIDPLALAEEQGNVFLVRGRGEGPPEAWWRPGMSGLAKIDAGRRSLLWIATHRTIDFFQLLMWW